MSKYHTWSESAARDWTTLEGITAGLRDKLKLRGYLTRFQVLRDGSPVDEETARQAIIAAVTSHPIIEKYQESLRKMTGVVADDREIFVEATPTAGGLRFKHGGYGQLLMDFGEFDVVSGRTLEERLKGRSKTEEEVEDKALRAKEKLDKTQDTDEDLYMFHAEQCGYLVSNTFIRLYNTGHDQRGVSTMTKIYGITLPELREFVDSAGNWTMSDVSTHADTSLEKEEHGKKEMNVVNAGHADFAKAIIEFLDMGCEVDIDGLKSEHAKAKRRIDSRFQSLAHWGVDGAEVLRSLIAHRKDLNSDEIERHFNSGSQAAGYPMPIKP